MEKKLSQDSTGKPISSICPRELQCPWEPLGSAGKAEEQCRTERRVGAQSPRTSANGVEVFPSLLQLTKISLQYKGLKIKVHRKTHYVFTGQTLPILFILKNTII